MSTLPKRALAIGGLAPRDDGELEFAYEIDRDDSQVDIFELGPALTALGTLIEQAHRALYPSDPELVIEVRPFREGSFGVDTVIAVAAHAAPLLAAVGPVMPHVIETLKTIGVISGGVVDLLRVIRELLDRSKSQKDDKHTGSTANDGSIVINGPVEQLIQNPLIIQSLEEAYSLPVKDPRVKRVRSYLKRDPTTVREVDTAEAERIRRFARGRESSSPDVAPAEDVITIAYLNPKRGSFEGEGGHWSFRKGGQTITATIKDRRFLRDIQDGMIRPSHSDLLKVRLRERQRVTGTKVRPSIFEILEVLEYLRAERQGDLPETG